MSTPVQPKIEHESDAGKRKLSGGSDDQAIPEKQPVAKQPRLSSVHSRYEELVNSEYLADVVFLVGSKREKIFAHKIIMTMASEVMYTYFKDAAQDNLQEPVVVPDIETPSFLELLRFMYCGAANISAEVLVDLYYGSQKYSLQGLTTSCESFVKNDLDETGVCRALQSNRKRQFAFIDESCLKIFQNNPLKCFRQDDFLLLDKASLEMILAVEEMNCKSAQLQLGLDAWMSNNNVPAKKGDKLREAAAVKRKLSCIRLKNYDRCHFTNSSVSEVTVRTYNAPLRLYGVGFFVGAEYEPADTTHVDITIDVKGASSAYTETKKLALKQEVYVHETMFEEMRFDAGDLVKITVTMKAHEETKPLPRLFCFDDFKSIPNLHLMVSVTEPLPPIAATAAAAVKYELDENNDDDCVYQRQNCFVASLLYNVK